MRSRASHWRRQTDSLPPIGPLVIDVSTDAAPLVIRQGQTLNLGDGGTLVTISARAGEEDIADRAAGDIHCAAV